MHLSLKNDNTDLWALTGNKWGFTMYSIRIEGRL